MAEIKALNLSTLHQEEDFGFHKVVIVETAKCKDAKFTPVQQVYEAAFKTFDESLKQGGGENVLSKSIAKQDAVCDNLYRGLSAQVKSMVGYFDPAIAEVARQANLILKKYGNPTALPFLEEAGVLHNLLQELEVFDGSTESDSPSEISDEITTKRLAAIHIDGWVSQLKIETARFLELFSNRNTQNAKIVTGATKAARIAIDVAYRDVVKRINSLAEVNGDTEYIGIINALNTLISRQQAILATRVTNNEKKREEEEALKNKPVAE